MEAKDEAIRTERIELRLSANEAEIVRRAAALEGVPIAVWLRSKGIVAARRELER